MTKQNTAKGKLPDARQRFYDCSWDGEEESLVPSSGHYQNHRAWGETPCLRSVMERRLYEWVRKYGAVAGFTERKAGARKGKRIFYDCFWDGEWGSLSPSSAHYLHHLYHGEERCLRSRIERRMKRYFRDKGSLEGFRWWGEGSKWEFDCSGDAPVPPVPSLEHYEAHCKRGESPCPASRAEAGMIPPSPPEKGVPHECDPSTAPLVPSMAGYARHRRRGEEPCSRSRAEVLLYNEKSRAA